MTKAEKFFYDNAGYSRDPQKETEHEARLRCARAMAAAEAYASEQGLAYEWDYDLDGCIGCDCGVADCACSTGEAHETLFCLLRNPDNNEVLASLGGICGATSEYRRVVEAELALEAMPSEVRA